MKKLTIEDFIKRAKEVHGNKYDYSKVDYINARTKVIIICPKHGEFEQIPNSHLIGYGCKECLKSNTKLFIKKAIKVHGSKYDYSKVDYVNCKIEIIIICPVHGEFKQIPNSHLTGNGCSKCSKREKLTTEDFIKRAKEIHNNKYDYSKVNYINYKTKVIIICPVHGEFEQIPNSHLLGFGCARCTGNKKLNTEEFINKAIKVHGNKYDYSKVIYSNIFKKVIIICPIHGEFKQSPNHHLNGYSCKICSNSVSLLSQKWLDSLKNSNIIREYNIKVNKKSYFVDGFDPKTKTVYEFNGDFWHGNPELYKYNDINPKNKKTFGELYKLTKEKENIIRNAGYLLISIWEKDFKEKING